MKKQRIFPSKGKKGIVDWTLILGIVALIALILSLFALKGLGASATSFTLPTAGCKSPTLQAKITGDFVVKDGSVIGVEPVVDKIENIGLGVNKLSLEPFNYEVELIDSETGLSLDRVGGNSALDSDAKELKIPFALYYKSPDNNCDGRLDDTRLTIKVSTVETQDVFKDSSVKTKDFSVVNGGILQ